MEPVPEPPSGRACRLAGFGAGGPAAVDGRELLEPVAFQAVQQPPQHQDPLGGNRISQPVQVLGGQLVGGRGQGGQPVWLPARLVTWWLGRMVFESMAAT